MGEFVDHEAMAADLRIRDFGDEGTGIKQTSHQGMEHAVEPISIQDFSIALGAAEKW